MIIIQLAGGLGNQLQQYALYQKFVHMGKAVRLDVSWFNTDKETLVTDRKLELNLFDRLQYEICTRDEKEKLIGADGITGQVRRKLLPFTVHQFQESKMYHPEIFDFQDMYLQGYFACEKYYEDILYDLREKLQFPPSKNSRNEEIAEEMRNVESVSLHLRRGDYLQSENQRMFGNICTESYYHSAVQKIKTICDNPHFYVFSDDVSYARQEFRGDEFTIVDINHGQDSFYDIWLMSQCRHNICANSTFSFWGARLNRNESKVMIRPTIHKNSQIYNKNEMQALWPGWTFVSPKGEID